MIPGAYEAVGKNDIQDVVLRYWNSIFMLGSKWKRCSERPEIHAARPSLASTPL